MWNIRGRKNEFSKVYELQFPEDTEEIEFIFINQGGQIFIIDKWIILLYIRTTSHPLRIQYEGALYHVICRWTERSDIFQGDLDWFTAQSALKGRS